MDIRFYILCISAAAAAYLLGGLNPAIIISKALYRQDIRKLGSGNPGFTNFKRVYGLNPASVSVMLLDILKTAVPAFTASVIFGSLYGMPQFGAAFTGLFGMLGHCFPVWYGFKGGKAFMAGFATIWFVDWRMALIAMAVFFAVLFTLRYMSVASCVASATCPVALLIIMLVTGSFDAKVWILCLLSAALVIVRHKSNFEKLKNHTESKFYLKSKKQS